ncbi:DUF2171 domain-containing protein [Hyalangium versicolor]|uniref:DUF2171 domain-containing protein n=1 Tax=Hyalangium versicolor TaxID=2861190 RepID=UPI001CCB04EB|nr:DUF2171 domain-containing protein [Hyalangium versicolor]
MIDPGELHEGMTVRDVDGRKLGTVGNMGATQFELEQGSPARRDFVVHVHQVARVQERDVFLHPHPRVAVPPEEEELLRR